MYSQHGDFIGSPSNFEQADTPYFFTPGDSLIEARRNDRNGITVFVRRGGEWWNLDFIGTNNATLQTGTYAGVATEFPPNYNRPALFVYGNGRSPGKLTGYFTISELAYDDTGAVTKLHLIFEQCANGPGASLFGEVWFNASSYLPPSRIGCGSGAYKQPFSWKIPAGLRVGNYACRTLPEGLSCDPVSGVISGYPSVYGDFYVGYEVDSETGPIAGTIVLRIAPPAEITSSTIRLTNDYDPTNTTYRGTLANGGLSATDTSGFPGVQVNYYDNGGLFVELTGEFSFHHFIEYQLNFEPAPGGALQLGIYADVSPEPSTTSPALLNLSSLPPAMADAPKESFQINELEYGGPYGDVTRFSANFALRSPFGYHAAMSGEIRFNARLQIDSARVVAARAGQPLHYQIAANNSPTLFWSTDLPAGLSLDPQSGVISGTPTSNGYTLVTISAMGTGGIASAAISIETAPLPPVITSARRADVVVGDQMTYQLTSLNGPVTYSVTDVSPLHFDPATGVISGTINQERSIGFNATATNAYGSYTLPISLYFNNRPYILSNVSTRGNVQTGDNVMIGGFVISGDKPKQVIVRAIAPSLAVHYPSLNLLTDPTIELHDSTGRVIAFNDNWQDSQAAAIQASSYAPADPRESAVLATLPPGSYTAIVRGKSSETGLGLVEVWDLDKNSSRLANISTRGRVGTGDNVLIGGFIVGHISGAKVLIRAISPSLANQGVPAGEVLDDPVLELYNPSGILMARNDNWQDTDEENIVNTGFPPKNSREAALIVFLESGSYTAIVRGKNGATGIALVEIYWLDPRF